MTLNYSRIEVGAATRFSIGVSTSLIVTKTFGVFLFSNSFRLPISFFIYGLPVDGTMSINWAINYLFQLFTSTCLLTFFLSYIPLTMIMINHACWIIDSAKFSVQEINELVSDAGTFNSPEISAKVAIVVEKICKLIQYQNKSRKLLRLILCAELFSLSVVICMNMRSLVANFHRTATPTTALLINLWQLFVYCLMGTRVSTHLEQLVVSIYDVKWYMLHSKQRSDLQFTLQICQNIKLFHGIFKDVNFATFLTVSWNSKLQV